MFFFFFFSYIYIGIRGLKASNVGLAILLFCFFVNLSPHMHSPINPYFEIILT